MQPNRQSPSPRVKAKFSARTVEPPSKPPPQLGPIPAAMKLMSEQHGAAACAQLRECGISARRERLLVEKGLLLVHAPGVVVDAATAMTWERQAKAATLAPGTSPLLTGAASARLLSMDGFADIGRIIVAVPHGSRIKVAPSVTVVHARYLPDEDVVVVNGIRSVNEGATLVSLARTKHSQRAQALDSAIRDGSDPAALRQLFQRYQRRGATGATEMIRMLDERVDRRLPRSWFQRLAKTMLASRGLVLEDEWEVRDERGTLLAELDLAAVDLQVAVECQSWQWHGSPGAQARDAARKSRLRGMGWDILELWWSDLDCIDRVANDFADALDRAQLVREGRQARLDAQTNDSPSQS